MENLLNSYSDISSQTSFQVEQDGVILDYIPTKDELRTYREKERRKHSNSLSSKLPLNKCNDF